MGKPGAILLIGGGLFIMALGWSGKLSMVWDIMKGNIPTPDLPAPGDILDETPPNRDPKPTQPEPQPEGPKGTCGAGQQLVVIRADDNQICAMVTDLSGRIAGNKCPNSYPIEVTRPQDGFNMCLKSVRGAGEVPPDYAYILQPTGATVARYQPNVRATD